MEFLVEIELRIPVDLDAGTRAALQEAEVVRGRKLAEAGILRAIWRVPGRRANCGIWSAVNATALHEALVSLPLWPYMDVAVSPLGRHPLSSSCPGLPAGLEQGEAERDPELS
jgi:muconolactone D-isomerase